LLQINLVINGLHPNGAARALAFLAPRGDSLKWKPRRRNHEDKFDWFDYRNSAIIHTGKYLKSKIGWDRNVLRATATQSGAVTVESYSLAPDGGMPGRRGKTGAPAGHPRLPAPIAQLQRFRPYSVI